jgi:NAD-dependent dihydropyrimidine dehydrogenase PreA subunit/DNA-binding transcriptional ArsR family regulator
MDNVPEAYVALQERLAKSGEGAPKADELFEILSILFTEEEALVASKMPMLPATFDDLAEATGMDSDRLADIIDSMTDKGLVIDVERKGNKRYTLAPPVIGFLEFTFMKRNEHLPMKRLAELSEAYITNHLGNEVAGADTERVRVVPYVSAFGEMTTEVVTYEQARELIKKAGRWALTRCFCRRQAHLLERGCEMPVEDICMGLGSGADWMIRHGFGREVSLDEMLAKLDKTEELGLVHTSDNVQERSVFMCNCCGCCCHILRGIVELNLPKTAAPSSYIAHVDEGECAGCAACEERCQIGAITVDDGAAQVKLDCCIGCGVCVPTCPTEAITLQKRDSAAEPPRNIFDLFMRRAQEKGRLKNYNA